MTDTPSSGVEAPSRFLMGLDDDPTADEAAMDAAIAKAFPSVQPNDITVGNPNNVGDADGADGGGQDGEPDDDAEDTQDTTVSTSVGDEPPTDTTQGEVQGGDGNDVATGEVDFAALFTQRYGRPPNAREYDGLLELADWANNLTPYQQEAINRVLSGQPVQEQASPQTHAPAPVPQDQADNDPILAAAIEQYGEDDPIVQHMRRQQEELTNLRGRYQEDLGQRRQQEVVTAIHKASDTFKGRMQVEDVDLQRLQGAVTRAGIFPAFVQANGGNVELAMNAALEWAYWQDEPCRERELQKRVTTHPTVQTNHETRKTKAASVTGTGGNGASRTDAPSKATSDPWAAVADGLREAQNNGVPS